MNTANPTDTASGYACCSTVAHQQLLVMPPAGGIAPAVGRTARLWTPAHLALSECAAQLSAAPAVCCLSGRHVYSDALPKSNDIPPGPGPQARNLFAKRPAIRVSEPPSPPVREVGVCFYTRNAPLSANRIKGSVSSAKCFYAGFICQCDKL